ncbi:MAG: glutamate mutase L [Actinobacteria bacterium]|nr:glutamate mutase L [Actinomycetota bacterium]
MRVHLLVDIGSTYTKVLAVDLANETILGRAQSPTTIATDVTIGLNNALSQLVEGFGIDLDEVERKYASSSAAGGLKMAAIGLVPELTLEAARRACLGAGAKLVCGYGFEIDNEVVREIEAARCDIILLCGGTDGGDKKTIIHNAGMLSRSGVDCPILVAGNRVVGDAVRETLESAGKKVYRAGNVLPRLDTVEVGPAQELIREIFIAHITKAKGLEKAADFIGGAIIPTPKATLQAAALLADGAEGEPGMGSLLIVEVGGATTNVHSVIDQSLVTPQTVLRGLPESRVKRTVEGDLGIRYNAPTIYDFVGRDAFMAKLRALCARSAHAPAEQGSAPCGPAADGPAEAFLLYEQGFDLDEHIDFLSKNVGHAPSTELGLTADIVLAESAAAIAVERHAGTVRQEFSVVGEIMVQHGKNLLETQNLIGTGGIFRYGLHPERVLRSALFSPAAPWSLKPRSPRMFIDRDYMLYGIGLLAEDHPVAALRIAKKYLAETMPQERVAGNHSGEDSRWKHGSWGVA